VARWLVVGEGPSELGTEDRTGFAQRLVAALCAGAESELTQALSTVPRPAATCPDMRPLRTAQLGLWDKEVRSPKPKGMGLISARACRAAKALQCDAIVVLVDRDHKSERRSELDQGIEGCPQPRAVGVATEMLEAWILADPDILREAGISLPKKPEELWGDRKDPESNHPKHVLSRVQSALRDKHLYDTMDRWSLTRALGDAPSLRAFCEELAALVRQLPPAAD
jgi:hypothetical protein